MGIEEPLFIPLRIYSQDTGVIKTMLSPLMNSCFEILDTSHSHVVPVAERMCLALGFIVGAVEGKLLLTLCSASPASNDCGIPFLFLLLVLFDCVIPPLETVLIGVHHSVTLPRAMFMCRSNANKSPSHTPLTPAQCRIITLTRLPSR